MEDLGGSWPLVSSLRFSKTVFSRNRAGVRAAPGLDSRAHAIVFKYDVTRGARLAHYHASELYYRRTVAASGRPRDLARGAAGDRIAQHAPAVPVRQSRGRSTDYDFVRLSSPQTFLLPRRRGVELRRGLRPVASAITSSSGTTASSGPNPTSTFRREAIDARASLDCCRFRAFPETGNSVARHASIGCYNQFYPLVVAECSNILLYISVCRNECALTSSLVRRHAGGAGSAPLAAQLSGASDTPRRNRRPGIRERTLFATDANRLDCCPTTTGF